MVEQQQARAAMVALRAEAIATIRELPDGPRKALGEQLIAREASTLALIRHAHGAPLRLARAYLQVDR